MPNDQRSHGRRSPGDVSGTRYVASPSKKVLASVLSASGTASADGSESQDAADLASGCELIWRRPFDPINHHHIDKRPGWLKLQPELFLECPEDIGWRIGVASIIRQLADQPPLNPPGWRQVMIVSRAAQFGVYRQVGIMREEIDGADLGVVYSEEDAWKFLGIKGSPQFASAG